MAKEIEVQNEDGTTVKETVYTADEYKAVEDKAALVDTLQTDLAEAKRVNAERGENFTAYSKMSEEEKKVYDANTTNLLKREEELTKKIEELSGVVATKETKEREASKTAALQNLHKGDEASKTKVEKAYADLAGMPETTQSEIDARARAAAAVAGIVIDQRNPLFIHADGEAPAAGGSKEYVETAEGKQAADLVRAAMGMPAGK